MSADLDLGHPGRVAPIFSAGGTVVRLEGTDVVALVYETGGRPCLIAWRGRSAKPLFHHAYPSAEQRDRKLAGLAAACRDAAAQKAAKAAARREYRHALQVGDVLVSTWGYDQTNVDFYVVVARTEKTVDLEAVGSRTVAEKGWMVRDVLPDVEARSGEVLRGKRVSERGSVKIGDHRWASPHDGRPVCETSYA